jgi:hypothetical protein
MLCATPPPTTACVPCIHPFEYLFELAYVTTTGTNNRTGFDEAINRLLDKGISIPSCKLCCPDCDGVYSFSSVETFLKLIEAMVNWPDFYDQPGACCTNTFTSTETFLKLAEFAEAGTGNEFGYSIIECCNGFNECKDELICWFTETARNSQDSIDRIIDKGIVEYGAIQNNCTGAVSSSICKLVDLLERYENISLAGSRAQLIDYLLDKGITISCFEGETHIASTETWLKYGEAINAFNNPVLAISNTTTTTTTV